MRNASDACHVKCPDFMHRVVVVVVVVVVLVVEIAALGF